MRKRIITTCLNVRFVGITTGIVVISLLSVSIGLSTANPAPDWTAEGNQAYARFGWAVSTAGDVNGDGFDDVIVGAPYYSNDERQEGRVVVYYGSAMGLNHIPDWTAEGGQAGAEFGWSVGTAGDVNGDGFADVIVGAKGYDKGKKHQGRGLVYYGSSKGLSATPDWIVKGEQGTTCFGCSVNTAGDVNGDGFDDVIIGAHTCTDTAGRAFVYHGSTDGLSSTPDWIASGDRMMAWSACLVGTVGDVNGDGFDDVIIGIHKCVKARGKTVVIYHGSATGLEPTPAWSADEIQFWGRFGLAVDSAGDVNGDGYADVIVGAPGKCGAGIGCVYVYHGSATGLSTNPSWTIDHDPAESYFGWSVNSIGDVNDDGYADIIIGAILDDNDRKNEGTAFIYHGSVAGVNPTPVCTLEGDQIDAYFGVSVSTAGDVNGDGFADIIVGACCYDRDEEDEGMVFVYYGHGDKTMALSQQEPQEGP